MGPLRGARRVTSALFVAAALPVLAAGGCADEGQGERCTLFAGGDAGENGTSECAAGLVCAPQTIYTTPLPGDGKLGVCCPPPGTPATDPACVPTPGGSTNGGPPVGDGSFDAVSTDAGSGESDAGRSDAGKSDAGKSDATTGNPLDIASTSGCAKDSA